MLSWDFCKTFKNTYFAEHLGAAACEKRHSRKKDFPSLINYKLGIFEKFQHKKVSTIDKKLNDMKRAGSYITQKLRVTITTDEIAPYN